MGSIEGDPFIPAADGGLFAVFSGQMRLILGNVKKITDVVRTPMRVRSAPDFSKTTAEAFFASDAGDAPGGHCYQPCHLQLLCSPWEQDHSSFWDFVLHEIGTKDGIVPAREPDSGTFTTCRTAVTALGPFNSLA